MLKPLRANPAAFVHAWYWRADRDWRVGLGLWMTKLSFKFVIPCNKLENLAFGWFCWYVDNKDYIFAYSNYRRNNHLNQYAWISQVHVAKPVVVDGLCYLNWPILSQQNVTDVIYQEKQCSKFVTRCFHQTAQFHLWKLILNTVKFNQLWTGRPNFSKILQ